MIIADWRLNFAPIRHYLQSISTRSLFCQLYTNKFFFAKAFQLRIYSYLQDFFWLFMKFFDKTTIYWLDRDYDEKVSYQSYC